mmetsp:Transcript_16144/g.49348  ORF Transcript_16144/g.49348 Transcript_16144/m.49348 type:complete len:205 (+) Transcript_16144:250-864(+)
MWIAIPACATASVIVERLSSFARRKATMNCACASGRGTSSSGSRLVVSQVERGYLILLLLRGAVIILYCLLRGAVKSPENCRLLGVVEAADFSSVAWRRSRESFWYGCPMLRFCCCEMAKTAAMGGWVTWLSGTACVLRSMSSRSSGVLRVNACDEIHRGLLIRWRSPRRGPHRPAVAAPVRGLRPSASRGSAPRGTGSAPVTP